MKKIMTVFLSAVIAVSMCACKGGKNVKLEPKLNQPFTVTSKIAYDDQESDAVLRRFGTANWDVEFSSPNTLAGVVLSYRDDNVEASYKGLSFSVPKTALPVKSIISCLIEAVDTVAAQPETQAVEKDGVMTVEGELTQGKYTMTFDKDGGISGFAMPNLELQITFSDFHGDNTDSPEVTSEAVTATVPTTVAAVTESVTETT